MYCVRAGLPIQELAFLGRWKSNVALTYAEEALQEQAVFVPDLHGKEISTQVDVLIEGTYTSAGSPSGAYMGPNYPSFDSNEVGRCPSRANARTARCSGL